MSDNETGLKLLRKPFPENQISKLPKPTRAQTDQVKADFKVGARCAVCGGWHHPKVVHLDYVGHAALTDRLLDADISWSWSFCTTKEDGLPLLDESGGLWISLTVCGVTRLGYGDAQGKAGGDAMKERIGDALRNAAMRFGAALDLWHKGDLHDEKLRNDVKEAKTVVADWFIRMIRCIDENIASISEIKIAISTENYSAAAEAWFELTAEHQNILWVAPANGGIFTTLERDVIQNKFNEFHPANKGADK